MAIASLLLFSASAQGWTTATSDDIWRSGWGQGTAEAQVTHGAGNEIYVACEAGSGFASSISFSLVGKPPAPNSEILLIFDKGAPESVHVDLRGRIASDNRASDSNFRYLIANFKKHQSVFIRFADGRESTFTLAGASKAIGDCRSTLLDGPTFPH